MTQSEHPTIRQRADRYVRDSAELDTSVATSLGLLPHDDRMPDFSPTGQQQKDQLARQVLIDIDTIEDAAGATGLPVEELRCATLLRDRLGVALEASESGEHLRDMRNIAGPVQQARSLFAMMPTAADDDWACIGRRMAKFGRCYDSYVEALNEGSRQGLFAAPLQAETILQQLDDWVAGGPGRTWFHDFVAAGPAAQAGELTAAADLAAAAVADLRAWIADSYLPASTGTPDAVGAERYRLNARRWMGADLDLAETYAWGWQEFRRINAEMHDCAGQILPGSTPVQAMRHLDTHGTLIEGVEEVRVWLQQMMDTAITDLDGTHFDIAEPIKSVEAMIAPPGSAAAPYYTRPSIDFARPGRTWLPTMGRTSFPAYDLVSTWYHEGVPGHHLQLAQWVHVAPQLSIYQTSLGSSSGATEGWALYAERLMDELGYLDTEARMGYLDGQMMRAVRVVVDLGMHLGLVIPDDSPIGPGQRWTPELATEFFAAHCGQPNDFIDSEIIRYLGWPGQAISYKLGERAWLAGREAARSAHASRGEAFDLKAWHMAGLSLGALGLDDLTRELSAL